MFVRCERAVRFNNSTFAKLSWMARQLRHIQDFSELVNWVNLMHSIKQLLVPPPIGFTFPDPPATTELRRSRSVRVNEMVAEPVKQGAASRSRLSRSWIGGDMDVSGMSCATNLTLSPPVPIFVAPACTTPGPAAPVRKRRRFSRQPPRDVRIVSYTEERVSPVSEAPPRPGAAPPFG